MDEYMFFNILDEEDIDNLECTMENFGQTLKRFYKNIIKLFC